MHSEIKEKEKKEDIFFYEENFNLIVWYIDFLLLFFNFYIVVEYFVSRCSLMLLFGEALK